MAPHNNSGSYRGGGSKKDSPRSDRGGSGHQGSSPAGRGSRGGGGPGRQVTVSKALSWLLRHGAAKERIAMDGQGYVRVDDLLRWQKLKVLGVGMEELVAVVEGNEKKRFALRWVGGKEDETSGARGEEVVARATTTDINTDASQSQTTAAKSTESQAQTETETETETETQRAMQHAATDLDPSHYLIRATQGHSLKTLDASAYLAPITLADPKSVPDTVVHGTFYGAWERILASGGLKPMTRVHVHFATGPRLEDVLRVLPSVDGREGGGQGEGEKEEEVSEAREKKFDNAVVISGMRSDAQILIYVDIRRALAAGVEFWRSENGVVLTEGGVAAGTGAEEGNKGKILSKPRPRIGQPQACISKPVVPSKALAWAFITGASLWSSSLGSPGLRPSPHLVGLGSCTHTNLVLHRNTIVTTVPPIEPRPVSPARSINCHPPFCASSSSCLPPPPPQRTVCPLCQRRANPLGRLSQSLLAYAISSHPRPCQPTTTSIPTDHFRPISHPFVYLAADKQPQPFNMAPKKYSALSATYAGRSASVDIPKPRDGLAQAGRDNFTAVVTNPPSNKKQQQQQHGMLPTPPNSISPNLPPHIHRTKPSKHNPDASPDLNAVLVDSDIDLQDTGDRGNNLGQPQHTSLNAEALDSLGDLDSVGAISPGMLAKHHLPDILLAHGPLAIRHVMGYLTTSVPGFSRISSAKARRLVVAALEGKGSGGEGAGRDGEVQFDKVGWGRWDARIKGQPPRDRQPTNISPPASMPSSYSHADLQIPGARSTSNAEDRFGTSLAGSSAFFSHSEVDEYDDVDMLENEADKMSLDGNGDGYASSSEAPEPLLDEDLGEGDVTDEEDWASIGAAALRARSLPSSGRLPSGGGHLYQPIADYPTTSRNRSQAGGTPVFANSVPQKAIPVHAKSGFALPAGVEVDNSREREAVEALLRLGSM